LRFNNQTRENAVNKQIITIAAIATLMLGGVAIAQPTPPPAAGSDANAMGKDKTETGNGGMAGEPDSAKTPKVEGKTGSQSGAHPADKIAPDQK
jgi:hypothetical protein